MACEGRAAVAAWFCVIGDDVTCCGRDVRLVRRSDRGQGHRPHPEMVLAGLCRQRAWEQARAAASGRSAVEVVERVVHVPAEHERTLRHDEWPPVLRELARQLDDGRIYRRDLPDLAIAVNELTAAYNRRQRTSRRRS